MNCHEWIFSVVTNLEISPSILRNIHLTSSASVVLLLSRNNVTVGTSRQPSLQTDVHIPA